MVMEEHSLDKADLADEPIAQWKETDREDGDDDDVLPSAMATAKSMRRSFNRRVILQAALTYGYLCHGLCTCFSGAALPDLRLRTHSNWEEISRAVVGRGVGMFFGAIAGGFLCDRFNNRLIALLALGPTLEAIGSFVIPWCTIWWTLMAMFSIQGITEGLLISAASKLTFQLWGKAAAAPVYATSLAFGLGAIVGPQIVEPFLGTHTHVVEPLNNSVAIMTSSIIQLTAINSTTSTESGYLLYSNQTHPHLPSNQSGVEVTKKIIPNNDSRIEYAYTLGGLMSLLAALTFLVLEFVSSKRKWDFHGGVSTSTEQQTPAEMMKNEKNRKDADNNSSSSKVSSASCTKGDTVFMVQILALMLFFYIHIVGGEWALDKFVFSYITEGPLHREPLEASVMVSVFWGCYTAGRGISALISRWVKPSYILATVVLGQLLAGILLCTEASNNLGVFWFVNCLYGLTIGPVYPGALVWVNRYIEVSGMVLAVVLVGGSAGGFIYQWIVGIVFELYGLNSLGYVMLVEGICITTTFVLLEILGRRHGSRFKKIMIPETEALGSHGNGKLSADEKENVYASMLMLSQS